MSTPQGPNGADRGQPGRKPEDRNGQETNSAPTGSGPSQNPGPASSDRTQEQAAAPSGKDSRPVDTGGDPSPQGPTSQSPQTSGAKQSAGASATSQTPAGQGVESQKPAGQGVESQKPAGQGTEQQNTLPNNGASVQGAPEQSKAQGKVPDSPTTETGSAHAGAGKPAGANSQQARPDQGVRPGGPTPPWQRGAAGAQSTAHQNTPQTNLPGVGPGLSKSGDNRGPSQVQRSGQGGASAPQRAAKASAGGSGAPASGAPTRPVVTGTAAAAMTGGAARAAGDRKAAAQAKSAVIDGPTRHIERKDLAKDLPDLSSVKHPSPAASPTTGETPTVGATTGAVPTVIAPSEPLRATVQVRRIDPWSMLKISSVISISLFFVWMIAVGLLYGVLAGMGVWDRLNSAFTDIVSEAGSDGLVTVGQVFGYATVIGLANTVLLTALATLGAFIYNLCTDLVGGVQVTLADPD